MKKISIKIIVMNLIIFSIAFGLFYTISTTMMKNAIETETVANLEHQMDKLSKDYDALFSVSENYTLSYRELLEDSLTLDILKDDKKSELVFNEFRKFGLPTVKALNLLDLYCWLAPEYVNSFFGLSIQNFKLDRNLSVVNPDPYTRKDIQGDSWQWFYGAEEDGINITKPYLWEGIEGKVISYTEALVVENKVVGIVGTDFIAGKFQDELLASRILDTGFFALADENLEMLFHPEQEGEKLADIYPDLSKSEIDQISNNDIGVIKFKNDRKTQLISYKKLFNGWYLLGFPTTDEIYRSSNRLMSILLLIMIISIIALIVATIYVAISISKPLEIVTANLKDVATGNLTAKIDINQKDEVGQLANALKVMISKLSSVVSGVLTGSEQIVLASSQLAEGNQNLAIRTEQQASALEETSAAIEEMNSSIRSNADNTITANKLSHDVADKTDEGFLAVNNVIDSMKDISTSSNRISDIIDVINNIAFQTNLLALNASIEAARAGEQGKGFAVVAVEVRKLAKRSDKAAAEISGIIKESNKKVDGGVVLANNAGKMLNDINGAVKKVTTLIGEISASSQEQLLSVDQIDQTLSSLDQNTQKNATLVEEASASTEELSAQAQELFNNMKFFKLGNKNKSLMSIKKLNDKPLKKEKYKSSKVIEKRDVTDESETFSEAFDESEFKEF